MSRSYFRSSRFDFQFGAAVGALLILCGSAFGGWFDNAWGFRRQVDVEWPAERAAGDELAEVEVYTGGKHKPDGSDIRVATDDAKLVASHVQRVGPGDKVRVVFALVANQKRYWVYWDNDKPAAAPKGMEDVGYHCGLLLDMHQWTGGVVNDFKQMEDSWARSKEPIGRKMIGTLELGINPFGDHEQTISRVSGTLFAPLDGTFTFAGAAQHRGALWIDGKPVLWVPGLVGDTRFSAKVELKRGRHEVVFYHLCIGEVGRGGDGRFSVAWQRPDMNRFDTIEPASFGVMGHPVVGALEERGHTFSADYKIEYLGETFFENHYTHRYRFTAYPPKIGNLPKYDWDFGDGQTASGDKVEHVFLTDGVYPVRVTLQVSGNTDARTHKLSVSRLYEHIDNPPTDQLSLHARLVGGYDLSKVPAGWLPWAALLFERAESWDSLVTVASRLAVSRDVDPGTAMFALNSGSRELLMHGREAAVLKLWESVPADSKMQPRAGRQYVQLLVWRVGDFKKAVEVLAPFVKGAPDDAALNRLYAQALVLAGRAAEGKKILEGLKPEGPLDRQAAMSGAMARTVEFYITEKDWETGEQTWEKWQAQYPAEFLEGYSVMLRTKLMEIRGAGDAAAKVAEAFAVAVPQSSYAPQLLDRASKLLAKSDPARSKSQREILKQKYPEDPLAQDVPTSKPK